ncbi:MAG: rhomboid family intrarane serine protease, partial [Pedosphaera sp.]|nr:rhomboid family intrarane serine protease [Pedosphaera sp.]
MDNDNLIFWFVVFSASVGLVVGLTRVRSAGPGWAVVCMAILLVAAGGRLWKQNALIYASLGMWLLFVMLPGIIGKAYHRRLLQQHYGAAHRLARIISWLHPFDGWRGQPEIVRAIELAHRGELGAASDFLKRFRGEKSLQGLAAMVNLY